MKTWNKKLVWSIILLAFGLFLMIFSLNSVYEKKVGTKIQSDMKMSSGDSLLVNNPEADVYITLVSDSEIVVNTLETSYKSKEIEGINRIDIVMDKADFELNRNVIWISSGSDVYYLAECSVDVVVEYYFFNIRFFGFLVGLVFFALGPILILDELKLGFWN